ncbi:dTDP-4-dehydrorhamnose reductase [Novacetimonas maltaceti]|uniref:dTDP-4-dehydrorhamnose reductase n=1 Tax=Novacetimonas maltaceti TaxID=1203393 RepID=A0A2S3VZG9_9PROT|nr:dTDP-4-dehydrorhamnose reductase [Novacetimonas maltaceti]POF62011.1 dTDP-4-dehydrorhamnose reductase [Novacetimonas maltaceti]PYD59138.1 dTDP-4-dehydrorhamnose reductase [Novacetimonas maltaceti]
MRLPKDGPIMVVGRSGQVATALARSGNPRIRCVGRPDLDFDRPETVTAAMEAINPVMVVNAAAWTAVDAAEDHVEAATRANRDGPALLARLCAQRDIPLVHISTDYVFDGRKGSPYVESDPTCPRTVYGRTKREGEEAVLAAHARAIILRTAWVYSAHGKNFVKTMLNAGEKHPTLRVVGDQHGNPTSATDLADAILKIVACLESRDWSEDMAGIYHAAGTGDATWHELARVTLHEAARHGRPMPEILSITTADWPTPAERPADSRLACDRLSTVFGIRLPEWRQSVARTVTEILGPTVS